MHQPSQRKFVVAHRAMLNQAIVPHQQVPARVPGHYERPGEILDVSAAEYGALFPLR